MQKLGELSRLSRAGLADTDDDYEGRARQHAVGDGKEPERTLILADDVKQGLS